MADIVPSAGNLSVGNLAQLVNGECVDPHAQAVYQFKPVDLEIKVKVVHKTDCKIDVYAQDGGPTTGWGHIVVIQAFNHIDGGVPYYYEHYADIYEPPVIGEGAQPCPDSGFQFGTATDRFFRTTEVANGCDSEYSSVRVMGLEWQEGPNPTSPVILTSYNLANSVGYGGCYLDPNWDVFEPVTTGIPAVDYYTYFCKFIPARVPSSGNNDLSGGSWVGVATNIIPGEIREIDLPGR